MTLLPLSPATWPKPDRAFRETIPGGIAGTRATLARMADFIRAARGDLRIRLLAVSIIAGLPHKAYAEQAASIADFVRDHIQFVRDVRGTETLTPPAYLIATRSGDCDDHSMLVAALLESIGLPTRLVTGGPSPDVMVHVWSEVKIGRDWYPCETTEPIRWGKRPRFPCYLVYPV